MTTPANGLSVTFWGAARTVTGSMHLVEYGKRRLLLDCGLFQGRRAEARERNSHFPFDPRRLDAVILSHAHMDHCGNLPNLVRQGFAGPIYCTPATRDLTAVMLADSAKIQEEDAAFLNRKRRGEPPVEPLYRRPDVHRTVRHVEAVPYERGFEVGRGVRVEFVDAGHLLGSAMVRMTFPGGGERTITFTGDLGRRHLPILRDPAPVPPGELLITESTYGGRSHPPAEQMAEALAAVVRRTAERGGKVLVPAFSLGRTQTIVYFLQQLFRAGLLAPLPVFVDSPLASRATEVFRLHPDCFDEETALLLEDAPDLFGEGAVQYTRSVEESMQLNGRRDPCVIIAASGMCESGRILHHLRHNLEDERNTVLIIGYQAAETLGRRLVEKRPEVRIHGKLWKVRAEIVVMNGFSSHADQDDFQAFLGPLTGTTRKVCLVHGEMDQAEKLSARLGAMGFGEVRIPDRGETVNLEPLAA
jgi:metallo-beta-lactamase family protein